MTAVTEREEARPATGTEDGGVPARRAVIRWALRLFRREWRQQLLVLGMLAVAVAATVWGVGVATNTPPPATATYGTANAVISLPGGSPHLAAEVAAITQKYGPADVIENQALSTATTQSVELRAQDPHGRFGGPLLALDEGRYPAGPGQVALTRQLASLYNLRVGGNWHEGGKTWTVTGIVENPTDLNDEFALVAPGQVTAPTQVSILLNAPAQAARDQTAQHPGQQVPVFKGLPASASVALASQSASSGLITPATIVLVIAVLGLVFIGLVSVAGFTVLAQRRLRAFGMISALGATERNVRLVMTANGAAVGVAAAIAGAVIGAAAWFAYVPSLETATAHRIDPLNLPWWALATGVVLAVATSVLAARRPARTAARVPVVAALSGRPPEPKAVHRSAPPGLLLIAGGALCLLFSGGWSANSGSAALLLLAGLVGMVTGMFLLAPLCVVVLTAAAGSRVPVAVRIALRDLVRYRARSGAALAAVSFAVFLAMLISIIASVRFSNVLDYTGQNLTPNQLIVYTQQQGPNSVGAQSLTQNQITALQQKVDDFAATLRPRYVLTLDTVNATLQQKGRQNNNFSGTLYVATPQLLATYGITKPDPDADILSMRPGLAAEPRMQLLYGDLDPQRNPNANPSTADNPVIKTEASLPSGTSAPNTVITSRAIRRYHLHTVPDGWLIETSKPLTTAQISAARQIAANAGVSIETKSGELALGQISDGATALGLVIALGVLVMSVGLVRGETIGELRTLTAAGASSRVRRTITGATAGAIGLLGAILGAAVATIAGVSWARSSLSTTFGDVPVVNLLLILVGLPLVAAVGGWLLAGRPPPAISRQPLE